MIRFRPVSRSRRPLRPRAARYNLRHILLSLLALPLLLLFAAPLLAQTSDEADEIVSVRTDLISVPVIVTDKSGKRIANLTLPDFDVRDDGQPVKLTYFSAGTERIALLFALDASGSTREHITQQTDAALAMFTRFGKGSRIAVLPFSDRAEFSLPFTHDIADVASAFKIAVRPNQRTAIFDATLVALRAFNVAGADARERRIIILISDGLDTASRTAPDSVVNQARLRGVSIYVIHFPLFTPDANGLSMRRPAKGFRELAKQTGGAYFQLGDARSSLTPHATYDLAPVFQAITEDLQSQYVLGYYLGEAARSKGGEHRIQVSLTPQHKKLRVQLLRETYNLQSTQVTPVK